ncbi:hypothetical protein ABC195_00730 [Microbacterium sp. 2P01SA-2]|uniref:hypothetical protein n=1 Tax=unclassified Microbacterium TaxID=2609290 RepID=UPI0039A17619
MDFSWMWLLLVAAGAAMQVVSVVWLVRLRPDEPYPMWTFPTREPGRVRAVRIVGVAFIIFGSTMFTSSLSGLWFLGPIVVALAFVPMLVATYVVNGGSSSSGGQRAQSAPSASSD